MFELNLAIIPNRIYYLEGIQLSYIKIYVHIFNLWHSDKPCYIGTPEFMERTQLSERTVFEALAYLEKMGEIKRVQKGRKRYIVQPVRVLEVESEIVDKSVPDSTNSGHGCEIAHARVRAGSGQGCELAQYNNKINKETNKSFYLNTEKSGDKSKVDSLRSFPEKPNTAKNTTKFWEPGNPDYDRVNAK
jgi:hypothetical protein